MTMLVADAAPSGEILLGLLVVVLVGGVLFVGALVAVIVLIVRHQRSQRGTP